MVKEGAKSYTYGWLDKVMNITENGKVTNSYSYSMDGQIASSTEVGTALDKSFQTSYIWDGLALLKRGTTEYVNEPAVTGGNPILANGKGLFNDMLGNSLGVVGEKDKFIAIKRDAFGQTLANSAGNDYNLFTGKPQIGGLGYTFLFRNYRSSLGKWQTQDPIAIVMATSNVENMKLQSEFMASLGYPDGWNNLAYVNNHVTSSIDWQGGAEWVETSRVDNRKTLDTWLLVDSGNFNEPLTGDGGTYTKHILYVGGYTATDIANTYSGNTWTQVITYTFSGCHRYRTIKHYDTPHDPNPVTTYGLIMLDNHTATLTITRVWE
jgi:hypothetical protein